MLNITNKISFHRFRGLKDFDLWHEKNVWLGEYHDWSSSRRIDREKVGGQIGDRWDVRLGLSSTNLTYNSSRTKYYLNKIHRPNYVPLMFSSI